MMTISASLFTQPNLQVRIWFNDGVSGFAALNPVQNLTPTPYAIFAGSASNLSGTLGPAQLSGNYSGAVTLNNTANNLTGTFTGNGGGLTNVNAATLGGFGADQLWKTAGNNNTIAGVNFLGTPDNQPLDFRVNNGRALQLAPTTNTANFIGGDSHNFVAPGVLWRDHRRRRDAGVSRWLRTDEQDSRPLRHYRRWRGEHRQRHKQ